MTSNQTARIDDGGYPDPCLTKRETEVLLAWIHAETKAEVARTLYITTATINTHLDRIRRKYEAVDRSACTKAALVARALQDELIELGEL